MGMYDNDEFRRKKKDVINAYPSDGWKWRVEHMKNSQILAIWFDIQKRKNKPKKVSSQLTLFELYPEAMMTGGAR